MEKEQKERKEEILEKLRKAGSEEYVTEWNKDGTIGKQKEKTEMAKGKKSRKKGLDFESKVRKDFEEKGWVVAKYPNNIDLIERKIIPAKRKFNPFSKVMTIGTGFPDFICFKNNEAGGYIIWGVEVKVNGQLDREEKEKCAFLLDNKIFSEVVVAKKSEKTDSGIECVFFREKYLKEKDINL